MKIIKKIIKYSTDILKFSAFIFFARWCFPATDGYLHTLDKIEEFLKLAYNYKIPNFIENFHGFFGLYLYTILNFFYAKRLGIIDFLNKFPFWYSLIIIVFVLSGIYYEPLWFEDYYKNWEFWDSRSWIVLFFLGLTFLNVYATYKLVKFLIKKFPKKFGFLRYFYPEFLDKIPDVVVLFVTIVLMKKFIPLVIKYEDGTSPEHFYLSSGDYFLYLMIFFFIVKILFLFYNYYNKHFMRK